MNWKLRKKKKKEGMANLAGLVLKVERASLLPGNSLADGESPDEGEGAHGVHDCLFLFFLN